MKKSILFLSVLCLALASCENYYVEKLLDHTTVITDVQSYKITLSSSDYGSISTLEANISLAFKLDAERGNKTTLWLQFGCLHLSLPNFPNCRQAVPAR